MLQFRGDNSRYLKPPVGKASFEILKMASEGLLLPLRALINQAKKANRPARRAGVPLDGEGKAGGIRIEVIPLKNVGKRRFLVLFEENAAFSTLGCPDATHR